MVFLCSVWRDFLGLLQSRWLKTQWRDGRKIEEALAASAFDVEKLKRWQNIGGAAGNP